MGRSSKSAFGLCILAVQAWTIAPLCAQETISAVAEEILSAQLGPDVAARMRIQDAESAVGEKRYIEALYLMERALSIKFANGVVLPEDFEIKYARAAWAAGQHGLVRDWLGQYLSTTAESKTIHQREALELFTKAKQVLAEWQIARRQIDSAIAERDPRSVDLIVNMFHVLKELDATYGPEILFELAQVVRLNVEDPYSIFSEEGLEEELELTRDGIGILEECLLLIKLDQKEQQRLAADAKCLLADFKYVERSLLWRLGRVVKPVRPLPLMC